MPDDFEDIDIAPEERPPTRPIPRLAGSADDPSWKSGDPAAFGDDWRYGEYEESVLLEETVTALVPLLYAEAAEEGLSDTWIMSRAYDLAYARLAERRSRKGVAGG